MGQQLKGKEDSRTVINWTNMVKTLLCNFKMKYER